MIGFIAVDGGGSKTEIVLVNNLGDILAHEIISCTNPNDTSMEDSINKLEKVIKKFINIAKDNNLDIECIMLAIAGIEFGDSKEILKTQLMERLNFSNIYVEGDLASVVELGLSNLENGIVIISGTGFNMAIKKGCEHENVGGWGYLVDDYLSGFDLGKDALIYASKDINGVGESTVLSELLNKHFNSSLWYAMADIYEGGVKKVASLSRLVVEAYNIGDKVAKKIIESRIVKLSKVIKDKTKNVIKPLNVVLFGGIFENNSFIVHLLKKELGSDYFLSVSNEKTIYGTVGLAIKKIESVSEKFKFNFNKQYKERLK